MRASFANSLYREQVFAPRFACSSSALAGHGTDQAPRFPTKRISFTMKPAQLFLLLGCSVSLGACDAPDRDAAVASATAFVSSEGAMQAFATRDDALFYASVSVTLADGSRHYGRVFRADADGSDPADLGYDNAEQLSVQGANVAMVVPHIARTRSRVSPCVPCRTV